MSNENMTYQDLLQIVELIKSASHIGEFHLKMGELEVDLKRGANEISSAPLAAPSQIPTAAQKSEKSETKQRHGHVGGGEVLIEPATTDEVEAVISSRNAPPTYSPGAVLIKSPMVGTFFRAAEPGAAPFVEIGQTVDSASTVCLIEVMKLINSIPAGQSGIVTHILVVDGEPVEFGQLLMVIDPR